MMVGRAPSTVDHAPGMVEVMREHDGSVRRLATLHTEYGAQDRITAVTYSQERRSADEIVTARADM